MAVGQQILQLLYVRFRPIPVITKSLPIAPQSPSAELGRRGKELTRCKDLAARAREMAKYAYAKETRMTLLSIADDYDRMVTEIEATNEPSRN
jgi:hypothetical protein